MITHADKEFIQLLAEGLTSKEIGMYTKYAETSVQTIRERILKKLKAKNTAHLISIAYQKHILTVKRNETKNIEDYQVRQAG